MIKRYTILFALLLMLQFANAQSFTISPSNILDGTVDYNGMLELEIDMNNNTAGNIAFTYERLQNTCPVDWFTALCDYPSCYPNIPAGNTMDPVAQGGHGFIKLTIQPGGFAGSGTVVFKVFNADIPTDVDTITFNINSIVAIDRYDLSGKVSLYPNPASDHFRLAALNGSLDAGTLRVMSITGSEVLKTEIGTAAFHEVNVGDFAPGIYLVKYETADGIFTQKLIRN